MRRLCVCTFSLFFVCCLHLMNQNLTLLTYWLNELYKLIIKLIKPMMSFYQPFTDRSCSCDTKKLHFTFFSLL